ncbi:hypothetical protein [Micromonospora echinospora]|uniref:hypothetical protein n=1 Tax=Micromonospora echinospora TaxID=1877 RepID=UPI003A8A3E9D
MKDFGFWLGLALSVPLSIFANFATPALGRLLSRGSKRWSNLLREKEARIDKKARWYMENPEGLTAFGIYVLVRSLYNLSGMLICVFLGILGIMLQLQGDGQDAIIALTVGLAGALILSVTLSQRIEHATRIARSIRKLQDGPEVE